MKVSIISDTHFGYKWGGEREEDSFRNAEEAFEKSIDSDLIILPGDIFDKKIPKQEVLDKASNVLSKAMEGERTVETDTDLGIHGDGVPVVAIHGTHERRPENYTNPIELMDSTGHLHHIDDDKVVFEKNGEKVAVHGMSGVPERYAVKQLEEFNPKPVEDAFNILVLHQSIEGFVYTDQDKEYLSLEKLPEGFDLIVNGHIHWYNLNRFPGEKPLVLPGSTVTTQMRKVEAEKGKGFLKLDTDLGELEFVELDSPRDVHYVEVKTDNENWKNVRKKAERRLERIKSGKKPLVNLKIKGTVSNRVNPGELKQKFQKNMFLNVNSSVEQEETERESLEESKDPWEKGKEILFEEVDNSLDIDEEEFLQLLETGKSDEAADFLKESVSK